MVMTSPEGITWTIQTTPDGGQRGFFDIEYSASLGLFVAVGYSNIDDSNIITSPDGITWTKRENFAQLTRVVWAEEELLFVAATEHGNQVQHSTDGITWTEASSYAAVHYTGLAYSPALGLFCLMEEGGGNSYTSPDGDVWTTHSGVPASLNTGLIWVAPLGLFIASGAYQESTGKLPFATSADGITWVDYVPPLGYNPSVGAGYPMFSVRWDSFNSKLYAVVAGDNWNGFGDQLPSMYVLESTDGLTWSVDTTIPGVHEYAYPIYVPAPYQDIAVKDASSRVLLGNNTIVYYTAP
jgi:hypothetical protein